LRIRCAAQVKSTREIDALEITRGVPGLALADKSAKHAQPLLPAAVRVTSLSAVPVLKSLLV
jgi:hypothetical protein